MKEHTSHDGSCSRCRCSDEAWLRRARKAALHANHSNLNLVLVACVSQRLAACCDEGEKIFWDVRVLHVEEKGRLASSLPRIAVVLFGPHLF